jgi:hypothetical protein
MAGVVAYGWLSDLAAFTQMLWRTLPVDSSTLQAFLHENYPPFCNDVDQCAAFSDNLSMAESLKPAHEEVRG